MIDNFGVGLVYGFSIALCISLFGYVISCIIQFIKGGTRKADE